MAIYRERWTPAGPIRSSLPAETIAQEEERAAATVAEPAPLGLFGFAASTFTISAVFAGWFTPATAIFAMVPLIIFGGVVQFLAGMWAYRKGDTFAATAFGSFGGFNATYGVYSLLARAGLITGPGAGAGVVGVFLLCLCFIALMLTIAALWKNVALVGVLGCLTVAYGLLGIGLIANGSALMLHTGGYAGLVSSVLAFYAGGAMVVNSISARSIMPLGPSLPVNTANLAPAGAAPVGMTERLS
jgi:succinate-acetate transporter protein